jgi:hypothetical protein
MYWIHCWYWWNKEPEPIEKSTKLASAIVASFISVSAGKVAVSIAMVSSKERHRSFSSFSVSPREINSELHDAHRYNHSLRVV